MKLSRGGEAAEVRIEGEIAVIEGRRVPFRVARAGGRIEAIHVGPDIFRVLAVRDGGRVLVWCAGAVHEFRRAAGRAAAAGDDSGALLAPMPGRVRRVVRQTGETVQKGDVLLILEAMKMEHAIRAPRDGVVARLFHGEGELVESGAILVEIT